MKGGINLDNDIKLFEGQQIRSAWDNENIHNHLLAKLQ